MLVLENRTFLWNVNPIFLSKKGFENHVKLILIKSEKKSYILIKVFDAPNCKSSTKQ